jgi:hypothetical protein
MDNDDNYNLLYTRVYAFYASSATRNLRIGGMRVGEQEVATTLLASCLCHKCISLLTLKNATLTLMKQLTAADLGGDE